MDYGGGTTPFLDTIAEDGSVFEKAYATGPSTTQSMPGLMTGTYPSWFGGYPPIPESQKTLAEALSDAGYRTVGIHSNPWLHPSHRFDAGFDVYIDITEGEKQGSRPEPKAGKTVSPSRFDAAKGRALDTLKSIYYELPPSVRRVISQSYFTYHYLFNRANDTAKMAVDRAIKELDEQESNDLFLWTHFMDVHRPYTLPSGYDTDIWQTARITRPAYTNPTSGDQEHISQTYDRSVAYVDSQIERLYQEFERRGLDEETLFIITSDHGEEFGEHGDWFHRNFKLCDELLKIPLLIVHPDHEGRRVEKLVSLIDIAPTVLDHVGETLPDSMEGKSLVPGIKGEKFDGRDTVFSELYDPDRDRIAIRTRKWKFVQMDSDEELYRVGSGSAKHINRTDTKGIPPAIEKARNSFMSHRKQRNESKMDSSVAERLRELGYIE